MIKRAGLILSFIAMLTWTGMQLYPAVFQFLFPHAQLIQICSLYDIKTVMLDEKGQPVEVPSEQHKDDHCPLCLTRGDTPIPAAVMTIAMPTEKSAIAATFFCQENDPLKPRHCLQSPRAPPYFS